MPNDLALDVVWTVLPEARIVGGAVRDRLANRPVADTDLATPLPPEIVMARLEAAGLRAIPTGLAHGTVTALVGEHSFEITTLRQDVETDGRHAVVAFTDDWKSDAARRDFTINAMSMDRTGTVFDYFGGRDDLAAGIVRFVGEPATRIAEDYLRILRFFRFFARYGADEADGAAIAAIAAHRDGIRRLSVERVWQELKQILAAEDPRIALRLMNATGVLAVVLERPVSLERIEALVARGAPVDPLLRFAALAGFDPMLGERLKFSDAERSRLATLAAAPALPDATAETGMRRALADWDAATLIDRSWLDGGGTTLRQRLIELPRPVFPLQGRDALALGATPGPAIGAALAATRQWWLERNCTPNADECTKTLKTMLTHE